jgi:L-2-amino-thiazoline-4-carboxylic acid hydrolase
MSANLPPDRLNDIGVLTRREIEARILAPMIRAFADAFGREQVIEIAKRVIVDIAKEQGSALAQQMGGNSIAHFVASKTNWVKGDALTIEVLQSTQTQYDFNVTRCRYAEMYRALGIPELGVVLSCGRDGALGTGFNPDLKLTRTQTLMEGGTCCDFRYHLEQRTPSPDR